METDLSLVLFLISMCAQRALGFSKSSRPEGRNQAFCSSTESSPPFTERLPPAVEACPAGGPKTPV